MHITTPSVDNRLGHGTDMDTNVNDLHTLRDQLVSNKVGSNVDISEYLLKYNYRKYLDVYSDIFTLIEYNRISEFIEVLEEYIIKIGKHYTNKDIKIIRNYLMIISKYMRCLNMEIIKKILSSRDECECIVAVKYVIYAKLECFEVYTHDLYGIMNYKIVYKILKYQKTKGNFTNLVFNNNDYKLNNKKKLEINNNKSNINDYKLEIIDNKSNINQYLQISDEYKQISNLNNKDNKLNINLMYTEDNIIQDEDNKLLYKDIPSIRNQDIVEYILYIIDKIDLSTCKDKYDLFNILALFPNKEIPYEKIRSLYHRRYITYLGRFSLIRDMNISNMLNTDYFLDYCLTVKSECNRRLVDITRLIKSLYSSKDTRINPNEILLLYNLSKSVYILRKDLLRYPIVEILFHILVNDTKIEDVFTDKNIEYEYIYDILLSDTGEVIYNIEKEVDQYGKRNIKIFKCQETSDNYQVDEDIHERDKDIYKGDIQKGDWFDLKKYILNIITNLVLDYGNYKEMFIKNNGLRVVNMYKGEYPLEVLRIFKNYLYDTSMDNKILFLSFKDEWYEYYFTNHKGNLEILEVLFNLIRNLVTDKIMISEYLVSKLVMYYDILVKSSTKYKDDAILVHLIYILSNISANYPGFRDRILEDKTLVRLIKESFTRKVLHTPLVWLLINLSWNEEGYEKRVYKLKCMGIKEYILNIDTEDNTLLENIHTILENIK